jgi:phospholipid transport system substrate-binding protein
MISKVLKFVIVMFAVCNIANADVGQAKVFVEATSDSVLKVMESSKTASVKNSELIQIFQRVVDIDWIGRFVLGNNWRDLNNTQQAEYLRVYKEFLISRYVPLFKQYNGQKLRIEDVKDIGNGQYVVVTFITNMGDKKGEAKVEYRVKQSSGVFKVRDIIAEDVSMLSTQRSDFSSVISSKGYDFLINKLKDKANSNE